ncbi:metal ABC transporter solute-binding protein, Zn/Mn family [Marinomonas posidonica]|uniref:ABC-type metal ion transporter, periplasmic subunit n=1 Tax=Marinomonas posidonica (strain CECT 7376 / NCIMB 14433 / IVIA-Po-181) TaxID=491952 RepID=F6D133_MARPP|nr:zinc ABC transporter substrate-binding protein [Marinomonas posidonica]AEF54840.1 ABC-type metal ion transporter, periplasmic subunit [Marinomonas posidonica IVIA-Po-181]
MKHLSLALSLVSIAIFGFNSAQASQANPINVVASFTVLADVVQHVGGDYVKVTSLVPANGDPHDFEPSPKDVKAIKNAAATFISGEGLETWFARLVKASGSNRPTTLVSTGIKTHTFEEDGEQITDPHVWNSIPNVIQWVGNIEKALEKADPVDAAAYQANANTYIQQLKQLNQDIHAQINAIPKSQRQVLTSHDAFGYYGKEYAVHFLAPLGMSTETEATASDVAELIDQIKHEDVKIYFFENSNDSRLVKQIANATGAKPGGELYPEALSEASGPAPTYMQMMAYNTQQIVDALKK